MQVRHKTGLSAQIVAVCLSAQWLPAAAQYVPDAGSLMRQTEQTLKSNPAFQREVRMREALPPPMVFADDVNLTVSQFKFVGVNLLNPKDLLQMVDSYLNRPLKKLDLQHLTDSIMRTYRQAGWIIQVYIPKQNLGGDTLLIQVIETVPPNPTKP